MSKKDQNRNEEPVGTQENEHAEVEKPTDESGLGENQPKKKKKRLSKEEKLKEEVQALTSQVGDLKDKYLRLFAEFDNYKKRTVRERIELMKTAAQDTLSSLLSVLDDFDRARKNAENEESSEQFSEGVALVYQKLYNTLKAQGLEPMVSDGETFDPELHEAITEIPAPAEDMKGKVIDTIEKGYMLKDKIIRHAKVVVGK